MNGDKLILAMFSHNEFDSHIIKTYVDRNLSPSDIQVIPTTEENYIPFQICSLRFLGSLQFLNAMLDTLVKSLAENGVKI